MSTTRTVCSGEILTVGQGSISACILKKRTSSIMGGGRVTQVNSMAEWNSILDKAGNKAVSHHE